MKDSVINAIFWAGPVVAAAGVGILLWALLGDWSHQRRRGRKRRCPRCFYEMEGISGLLPRVRGYGEF